MDAHIGKQELSESEGRSCWRTGLLVGRSAWEHHWPKLASPWSHSLLYPPPVGKYFSASVVINTIERINQLAFFHDGKLLGGTEAMKIWIGRRRLEENVAVRGKGQI